MNRLSFISLCTTLLMPSMILSAQNSSNQGRESVVRRRQPSTTALSPNNIKDPHVLATRPAQTLRGLPNAPATAKYSLTLRYKINHPAIEGGVTDYAVLSQGKMLFDGGDGRLYVTSFRSNLPEQLSVTESALLDAVLCEAQKSPAGYGLFHKSARHNYVITERDTVLPGKEGEILRVKHYKPKNQSILLCEGMVVTDVAGHLIQTDLTRLHISGRQRVRTDYDDYERPVAMTLEMVTGFYEGRITAHLFLHHDDQPDPALFEQADQERPYGEVPKKLLAAADCRECPFDRDDFPESHEYFDEIIQLDPRIYVEEKGTDVTAITYADKFRSISRGGNKPTPLGLTLTGGTVRLTERDLLEFGGVLGLVQAYTPVDGLGLGQRLIYGHFFDRHTLVSFSPQAYSGLASKRWNWSLTGMIDLQGSNHRALRVELGGGRHTADIERFYGTDPFWEALSFFALSMNTLRYYDKSFACGKATIRFSDQITVSAMGWSEKRRPLHNVENTTLMGLAIEPNMPPEWEGLFPVHSAQIFHGALVWTPRVPLTFLSQLSEDRATITLEVEHGDIRVEEKKASEPFNFVTAHLRHVLHPGLFSSIYYGIGAGAYFDTKSLQLPDRHPFNESTAIVSSTNFDWTYALMPRYCTWGKHMVDGHLSLHTNMLLTGYIPTLQRLGFSEAVHLHGTMFDDKYYHVEGGYSIGIRESIRLGAFVAWGDEGYRGFCVRLSFPVLNELMNQFFPDVPAKPSL